MIKAAIMQPTFLPWLGYFGLMQSVDVFVFLDDVQFSKQSWQSRNYIKSRNGKLLVSLKIQKASLQTTIQEIKLADDGNQGKILASIEQCLGQAPYYKLANSIVKKGFNECHSSLAGLNIGIIEEIAKVSDIKAKIVKSSALGVGRGGRVTRLVEICKEVGADTYISPIGAQDYLHGDNSFQEAGIKLHFMNYEHPEYPQLFQPFVPFIGSIDALANVGPSTFAKLAKSGVK